MLTKFFKTFHTSGRKGFTLIELIVAIAIMVFILAVILVNYRKFDSGIVMTNLAYDIALSIRTAQTYGVSVKGASGDFSKSYGVSFNGNDPLWEKKYVIFVDRYSNYFYDNLDEPPVNTYNLRGAYYIKDLCTFDNVPTTSCGINKINITFLRPNPDARISVNDGGTQNVFVGVKIIIGSKQDATAEKIITVRSTGQISVN